MDDPNAPVDAAQDAVTHELYVIDRYPNWNAAFEPAFDPDMFDPAEDPEYNRAKRARLAR
jgi:hypothetical protein